MTRFFGLDASGATPLTARSDRWVGDVRLAATTCQTARSRCFLPAGPASRRLHRSGLSTLAQVTSWRGTQARLPPAHANEENGPDNLDEDEDDGQDYLLVVPPMQPAAVALMQPPPRFSAEAANGGRSAGPGQPKVAMPVRLLPPLLTAVLGTARDPDISLGLATQPGRPMGDRTVPPSGKAVLGPSRWDGAGPSLAPSSRVLGSRAAQAGLLPYSPPAEGIPGRSPGGIQREAAAEGAALRASLDATSTSSYTKVLDPPARGAERQQQGRMGNASFPDGRGSADRYLLPDTAEAADRQRGSAWFTAGSATATSEGRRIAARIRASGDWFQLRAVLAVSRESLNMLHVTSALSRLAAVAGYDKQAQEARDFATFLDALLLPAAARCLPDMGPRELCTCLHVLAMLRHAPPAAWTTRLLNAAHGQLQAFSPRDLSTLVWALGSLRALGGGCGRAVRAGDVMVSLDFLKAVEIACLGSLRRFNPQDLSTLAVGLDRLQHSPSPALASAYLECARAVLPQCRAQALSNILHSLDGMGVQPSRNWLRNFAAASLPVLPSCSGQALAVLAGAMGRLWQGGDHGGGRGGGREREEDAEEDGEPLLGGRWGGARGGWVGAPTGDEAPAEARTDTNLSSSPPRERGSASLGDSTEACPMAPWVRAVLGEAQRRFGSSTSLRLSSSSSRGGGLGSSSRSGGSLGPEDLVSLALALPALCLMSDLSRGGRRRRGSSSSSDGVGRYGDGRSGSGLVPPPGQAVDGGSRKRLVPPPDWADEGGSDEGFVPPAGWVDGLQEAMRHQLPAFSTTQLANGLMALARIHRQRRGLESREEQTTTLAPESESGGAHAYDEQRRDGRTASLPSAAAAAAFQPLDRGWLQEWLRATDRLAPAFNAADTAQALWALAALGASCTPQPPRLVAQQQKKQQIGVSLPRPPLSVHLQEKVPLATEGVLSAAAVAAPVLRVPPAWAEHMLASTRPRLAEMSSSQLSMLAWALSALRVRPGWQWSLALFSASAATMQRPPTVITQSTFIGAFNAAPLLQPSTSMGIESAEVATQQSATRGQAAEGGVKLSGVEGGVTPRDLAVLLLGLGHLRLRPLEAWTSSLMVTLLPMLGQGSLHGRALAYALWGMYRLRLVLSPGALTALMAHLRGPAAGLAGGCEKAAVAAWALAGLWGSARRMAIGGRGRDRRGTAASAAAAAGVVQRRGRRRRWQKLRQQQQLPAASDARAILEPEVEVLIAPIRRALGRVPLFSRTESGTESDSEPPAAAGRGPSPSPSVATPAPSSLPRQSSPPATTLRLVTKPGASRALAVSSKQRLARRRRRQRHTDALRDCLMALLLPKTLESAAAPSLSPDSNAPLHPTAPPMPARTLALSVAAWAMPGRDLPPPPETWLRLVLGSVGALAAVDAAAAPSLSRGMQDRVGSAAPGVPVPPCPAPAWDSVSFLTTLAALRKLRGRAGSTARGSTGGGSSGTSPWSVCASSSWSLRLIQAATLHVPQLHSQQLSAMMLGLAALCGPAAAAAACRPAATATAADPGTPGAGGLQAEACRLIEPASAVRGASAVKDAICVNSDLLSEVGWPAWDLRDQATSAAEAAGAKAETLTSAVDLLAAAVLRRWSLLAAVRRRMLRELPPGGAKRDVVVVMPPASTPTHTAGLAAAMVLGLRAGWLPKEGAAELRRELKVALEHLPGGGRCRRQAELALQALEPCVE